VVQITREHGNQTARPPRGAMWLTVPIGLIVGAGVVLAGIWVMMNSRIFGWVMIGLGCLLAVAVLLTLVTLVRTRR
jgi:hypothetical protein